MAGIKINGVDIPVGVHDVGDVGMILPTNGALMTDDQYEALQIYVAAAETPLEKSMLCQMKAMVVGVKAWERARNEQRDLYLEAETDLREVRLAMRKAHALLNRPMGKVKKGELVELVQQALDELDVFEVAEGGDE